MVVPSYYIGLKFPYIFQLELLFLLLLNKFVIIAGCCGWSVFLPSGVRSGRRIAPHQRRIEELHVHQRGRGPPRGHCHSLLHPQVNIT